MGTTIGEEGGRPGPRKKFKVICSNIKGYSMIEENKDSDITRCPLCGKSRLNLLKCREDVCNMKIVDCGEVAFPIKGGSFKKLNVFTDPVSY